MEFSVKVLVCIKHWGATGILIEWEDTFPYIAELVDIGSQQSPNGSGGDGLYSLQEVQHVFNFAKDIGLEVIQLIQTIGHMEFVLKHPAFSNLRETPRSSAVLCPLRQHSQGLVRTMLTQVLDAQPDARFIHIGADEVWHLGVCDQCKSRASSSRYGVTTLYLEHVSNLVTFIKLKRPGIVVMMWDDMIRNVGMDALREYKLHQLVEPVVWHYNPKECFSVDPTLWLVYGQMFPRVWAGSAFKGANGSSALYPQTLRYATNHEAWRNELRKFGSLVHFGGLVLTGWSRYDHYATLCELMTLSLPTLKSCLQVFMKTDHQSTESLLTDSLPPSEWPGEDVARAFLKFLAAKDRAFSFIHGDQVISWFSPWHQSNNYICPDQLENIASNAQHLLAELAAVDGELESHLLQVTGRRSAGELLETHLRPLRRQLAALRDQAAGRGAAGPGLFAAQ
ncbi:hexosaminidase D-like [Hyposmocoma kahamanoa]|uniref:hexosaminidase D-like n=1 Tax=Hyposmocoma kahamanoa TaxID=1477025 RepID=UPI000E6DA580|nr:hexosaminidase D-like [Hyposmocoma kahamanoa]